VSSHTRVQGVIQFPDEWDDDIVVARIVVDVATGFMSLRTAALSLRPTTTKRLRTGRIFRAIAFRFTVLVVSARRRLIHQPCLRGVNLMDFTRQFVGRRSVTWPRAAALGMAPLWPHTHRGSIVDRQRRGRTVVYYTNVTCSRGWQLGNVATFQPRGNPSERHSTQQITFVISSW